LRSFAVALALAVCAAGVAHAQAPPQAAAATVPVIYPAKGQSARQQDQDRYACYDRAREQSGFDPAQQREPASSGASKQAGAMTGAMARGALGGAAIGELGSHDAGRGAAVGVLGGAVVERVKQQQAAQARQQQSAQQQAARGQQRANYDRAFGACMEARGYVVR
jgi:hypothetical protein